MKRNQTPPSPTRVWQSWSTIRGSGRYCRAGISFGAFPKPVFIKAVSQGYFSTPCNLLQEFTCLKTICQLAAFSFFPIFQILLWDPKGAFAHPNFLICLLAIFKLADLIFAPKWVGTVGLGKQQTWWKIAAKTEFSPYQRGHCILPVLLLLMIPTKTLLLKCPNSRFPRLSQARIFCGVKGHYYLDRERD